jgi:hypothetical protein
MEGSSSRQFHRENSNPLLSSSIKQLRPVEKATLRSFKLSFFRVRTLLLFIAFSTSLVLTLFCHIYAYSRLPASHLLPDVVTDIWSDFGLCRSSVIGKIQLARLITFSLLIFCVVYSYRCYNVCNIRKYIAIFTLANCLRAVFLAATQLPPPCRGFPDCGCAEIPFEKLRATHSVGTMALFYALTLGAGTSDIPSCGDTMMSGNILVQCCLGHYLIETMRLMLTDDKIHAAKFTVFMLILTSSLYSILIRSEYTVGVVLSVVIVSLEAVVYEIGQKMTWASYGPFVTTTFGQLFSALDDDIDELDDDPT